MTNPLLAEIQRLAREGFGFEDIVVQIERTMHRLEKRGGFRGWRKMNGDVVWK